VNTVDASMSAMDDGNKMDSTTTTNICQVSGKCSDYQHSGFFFFIATFAFHPSHYTQPYLLMTLLTKSRPTSVATTTVLSILSTS
jgi:hypothetical protein